MSFWHIAGLGQSTQDYLNLISKYESANRNIPNYRYDPTHTAQGYYQITNQNWNNVAPQLGIDLSQYPNAMSAPQDVQAQVATYLLTQTPGGISNWAAYNPNLNAALSSAGLQTSGPVVDLSGNAAATPTSSVMDQITAQASAAGIDLTNPTTDLIIVAGLAAAVLLFARGR